jgi:hypothetical protein
VGGRTESRRTAQRIRSLFWGNRGRLLDAHGSLARHSLGYNWITCRLEFRGRHRVQWRPRRLTELYFPDKPTALAAGHGPCGECRHHDYQLFNAAWLRAHAQQRIDACELDRTLYPDRMGSAGHRTHAAALDSLPDGCLVECDDAFWLVRGAQLHAWTFCGYENPTPLTTFPERVTVRERPSRPLRAGYTPHEHPSATPTQEVQR